jgi:hypothetical protein
MKAYKIITWWGKDMEFYANKLPEGEQLRELCIEQFGWRGKWSEIGIDNGMSCVQIKEIEIIELKETK